MCGAARQSRGFLSPISLNHSYRAYAFYLSVSLANIRVHFCSTTVVNETRGTRERETDREKENTAVSEIRTRPRKKQKTMLCVRVCTRLQFAIFNRSIPLVYCCHSTCVFFLHLFFDSKRTSGPKIPPIHWASCFFPLQQDSFFFLFLFFFFFFCFSPLWRIYSHTTFPDHHHHHRVLSTLLSSEFSSPVTLCLTMLNRQRVAISNMHH